MLVGILQTLGLFFAGCITGFVLPFIFYQSKLSFEEKGKVFAYSMFASIFLVIIVWHVTLYLSNSVDYALEWLGLVLYGTPFITSAVFRVIMERRKMKLLKIRDETRDMIETRNGVHRNS